MDTDPKPAAALDFDTVVPVRASEATDESGGPPGVFCAVCHRTVTDEYYEANGNTLCDTCRVPVAELAEVPQGVAVLARAGALGVGAAIAGALLYYAVLALTQLEVGLVAIAIGYMVGYAVRRGAGGRGGRRFQVVALVLTYWAVGLAYTPMLSRAMADEAAAVAPSADGSAAPRAPDTGTRAVEADAAAGGLAAALAALAALTFALPVLTVASSLPGGLISEP